MKAKDIMTKNLQKISEKNSILEVARKMKEFDTGVLPVCEGEKLINVITDRDIVLKLADGLDLDSQVSEFDNKKIHINFENDDIDNISELMKNEQIHRVFILDNQKNKKLVGVISIGDIAKKTKDQNLSGKIIEKISQNQKAA